MRRTGAMGEKAAADYLRQKGMKLIARNYAIRGGEIDLIMLDGECTVFVEVKTRDENSMGDPLEYIDEKKRRRIIKTAIAYLGTDEVDMRFDAVEVIYRSKSQYFDVVSINHVENAFWQGF